MNQHAKKILFDICMDCNSDMTTYFYLKKSYHIYLFWNKRINEWQSPTNAVNPIEILILKNPHRHPVDSFTPAGNCVNRASAILGIAVGEIDAFRAGWAGLPKNYKNIKHQESYLFGKELASKFLSLL